MNRLRAITLLLLAAAPAVPAADIVAFRSSGRYGAVGYEATVIWGQGEYLLDMWAALDAAAQQSLAKSRQAAETALEQRLEAVFLQSVISLPLSSRETAGARLQANPSLMPGLKRLLASAVKRRSHLSEQMEDLRLRYAVPLYGEQGLLALFAPAGEPASVEPYLGFVPAAAHTGLVIYAKGSYPAWGRNGAQAALKPCLFPRIYDADMNLVLESAQVARPELQAWGPVAYSNDLDELPYMDRVGENPLRVVARGIYGVGDTDIVIGREAARILLSREENVLALRQGRILVILDAEGAPEPPELEASGGEPELEEVGAGSAAPAGGLTGR